MQYNRTAAKKVVYIGDNGFVCVCWLSLAGWLNMLFDVYLVVAVVNH